MRAVIGRLSLAAVMMVVILAAVALPLVGCAQQKSGVDWTVEISGSVDKPANVTYDEMLAMKQVKLQDVVMRKSRGEDQKNSWEGPLAMDVLAKAGLKSSATGITAMAADGYAIQIPKADLEKAIIAVKMDDKSINAEGKGAIRLIVPDKPANFWILGLKKMKVEEGEILPPTPKPDATPKP
jgi:DMSO/TMAO reductase YedYZ molybdopterin-dependent catalytic subunit